MSLDRVPMKQMTIMLMCNEHVHAVRTRARKRDVTCTHVRACSASSQHTYVCTYVSDHDCALQLTCSAEELVKMQSLGRFLSAGTPRHDISSFLSISTSGLNPPPPETHLVLPISRRLLLAASAVAQMRNLRARSTLPRTREPADARYSNPAYADVRKPEALRAWQTSLTKYERYPSKRTFCTQARICTQTLSDCTFARGHARTRARLSARA